MLVVINWFKNQRSILNYFRNDRFLHSVTTKCSLIDLKAPASVSWRCTTPKTARVTLPPRVTPWPHAALADGVRCRCHFRVCGLGYPHLQGLNVSPHCDDEGGGVAASYAIVIHTLLLLLLIWTHPHVLFLSLLFYVVFLHVYLWLLQSPCRHSLKGCPLIFLMAWKGLLSVRLRHYIHN